MPKEIVTIPRSELVGYEYAARVYEILAFPDDIKARERFGDALCFVAIKMIAEENAGWALQYQNIRPCHLLQNEHTVEMEFKRGVNVIRNERLIAAKMAAPTYASAQASEMGVALEPQPASTSRDVLAAVSIDLDDRPRRGKSKTRPSELNAGNLYHRHWKPSRPVLHLALALHHLLHLSGREVDVQFGTAHLRPQFVDELLCTADRVVPTLNAFGVGENEWIKIEIT